MTVSGQTPTYSVNAPATFITGTSAAATALSVAVPAQVPGNAGVQKQTVIPGILLSCTGAASGNVTLTVKDASATVLSLDISLTENTPYLVPLPGAIAITLGNAATVAVGAGATSCVVTADVAVMYV